MIFIFILDQLLCASGLVQFSMHVHFILKVRRNHDMYSRLLQHHLRDDHGHKVFKVQGVAKDPRTGSQAIKPDL